MHSKLMRSKYNIGTKLYYRSTYGFGIATGFVVGLHDDFIRVMVDPESVAEHIITVKFEDVLSIYEK